MSSKKPKSSNYVRKIRRLSKDAKDYIRLNFTRNYIQRITDFNDCERPVLLIYGFGGTRRIFTVLEKRLRKDGYCVFSIHLGGLFDTFNTGGIIKSAQLIQKKIEKLTSLYDLGPITIIGHSKGGLIGSYYLKFLEGDKKVCSLITLGSPYQGTPWAALGLFTPLALLSQSVRQLWPQAPFLRKLASKVMPEHVHHVSIYSKADMVCPYPYCKIDREHLPNVKNIEIENINHTQFVISRKVYETMKKEMLESFAKNQNSHVFQKNKPGETKASASNMASPTDGKEIDPKLAPQAVS